MKFKRFLSLTLSVLLVLGAVPAASLFVGAASDTYDIAAAFDNSKQVTVNGDTKSAADVFELKTMKADSIADYTNESIANCIGDDGLSVPYSTAGAVNFVQLKDNVVTGRQLQSYYVDFDASLLNVVQHGLGSLGISFANDGSGGYKLLQFQFDNNKTTLKFSLSTLSGTAMTAYNGSNYTWKTLTGFTIPDDVTTSQTLYFRVKFEYSYNAEGNVSSVKVTPYVYANSSDRAATADTSLVTTSAYALSASATAYKGYFTSDMTPCFAFFAGTNNQRPNAVKNVVMNYSKKDSDNIIAELSETINVPGATVKYNQIDNNNQLRFTADYTDFESVVTKYADSVSVTERGIYLLVGNKDAETLKKDGMVYKTNKDYTTYEENGATRTVDYWVVGGTADYVSTKVSVLAYAKVTVDGTEYTVYSDVCARSIVFVIRNILSAEIENNRGYLTSAIDTVNKSNTDYANYTYDDLMTNTVGKDTTKQAFVKAVFTQYCKNAGHITGEVA